MYTKKDRIATNNALERIEDNYRSIFEILFDDQGKSKLNAMTIEEELKDVLKCISIFDPGETLKNKGKYFEVIQKDVKKLLKRIKEAE